LADDRAETIAASLVRVLGRGARTTSRERMRELDENIVTEWVIGVYRSVLARAGHRARGEGAVSAVKEERAHL
jgi:hypothetical protein